MKKTRALKTIQEERELLDAVSALLSECERTVWIDVVDSDFYERDAIDMTASFKTLKDLMLKLKAQKLV